MDEEITDDGVDARGVLANWLDDYTAGRCDRAQMQASFLQICRDNPEAPWDALALLDQYQRRGRVDAALARSLKSDIAQLVFGVASQTEDSSAEQAEAGAPETTSVDTGTRWRKLAAGHDTPSSAGTGKAEEDSAEREIAQGASIFDPLARIPVTRDLSRDSPPRDANQASARYSRAHGAKAREAEARGAEANDSAARDPGAFGAAIRPSPGKHQHRSADGGVPNILRQRYELLTILGRGRSGTVYQALDRHRSHLDQSEQCVALRVLKPEYAFQPAVLTELTRQFHQAQSLSHPNIVSMFDLDRDGTTYFMVMELLQGESLAEVLQRLDHRPMARQRALSVVGSIGAALAHAHRRNIVHGDLKPAKVMITTAGDVKVLDLGFGRPRLPDAQRVEPWIGDAAGGSGGSAYASAEQVNGEPAQVSDDVYSLACIAYELLSGQHPYGGRSGPLARAQGRQPQRIAKLGNRQWQALRTALQWSREERNIDVVELIAGLGCADIEPQLASPSELLRSDVGLRGAGRSWLVWALLLAALVLGAVAWHQQWPLPKFQLNSTVHSPEKVPVAAGPDDAARVTTDATQAPPAPPSAAEKHNDQSAMAGSTTRPSDSAPAESSRAESALPQVQTLAPQTQAQNSVKPQTALAAPESSTATKPATETAAAGPAVIGFDKDTYVATEGDGAVKLTVKRTGSLRKAVTFHWKVLPNSAQEGNDYVDLGPGTERIPAGVSTAALVIPLVNDAVKENTELFLVELSVDEDGPALGPVSRAAVIIVDDD